MKKIFGFGKKKDVGRQGTGYDDCDSDEFDEEFDEEDDYDEYDDEYSEDGVDNYDEDDDYENASTDETYNEVDCDNNSNEDNYDDSYYERKLFNADSVDADDDDELTDEEYDGIDYDDEPADEEYDNLDYDNEPADEEYDDLDYDDEPADEKYDDLDYDNEPADEEYDDLDYDNESEDYGVEDYESEQKDSIGRKIIAFVMNTSAAERIAAIFALLILAGGIFTVTFYASTMNNSKQLDTFAEIGSTMEEIEVVGQSGLLAVADAEKARAIAASLVSEDTMEEEEEVEVADDAEGVTIKMTVTSIKSDIKVKFINSETNKLVASVPFEINVENPDGSTVTYNDHDQDGIIYKKDITAGNYKITPKKLPSEYDKYNLEIQTKTLTVKDTVEMKVVDVSNEVKKESQVNVAAEDTAVKTAVESTLTDTVEWVESTKTAVGESSDGNYTYEEIDKNSITNPTSSSSLLMGSYIKYAFGNMMLDNVSATDASSLVSTSKDNNEPSDSSNSEASEKKESNSGEGNTVDNSNKGDDSGNTGNTSNEENNDKKNDKESKKSISVNSSNVSIKVNETASISISGPSSASFSSDNESIATVSGSGNTATIVGKKAGTATITVTSDGYESAKVSVTVTEAAKENMKVSSSSISIKAGKEEKITVTGPASPTFKSGDETIATVTGDGTTATVSAKKAGTVTITITAEGYNDATVSVTVTEADKGTIEVTASASSIKIGDNATLTVKGPSKYTFKSNDEKIAKVDANGKVIGVSKGEAKITVSAENYNDTTIAITVTDKSDTKVPMSISKITLVEGQTIKVTSSNSSVSVSLTCSDGNVAVVSGNSITAKAAGTATITVSASGYADNSVALTVTSNNTTLKDKNGNVVYVLNSDGSYREATYNDYYNGSKFYLRKAATEYRYTGWQTIGGKTYFFDKNGNYVTGEQVIQGAKYTFGADGALSTGSGTRGIDVSKWNGNIDWAAVKNSGIQFVIIRCGYRGSSQGALIEDPTFKKNIKGAVNAGLNVGVYFFTQAVNEVEAVEEASMVINLIKGYNITYPVYLDVEASNGRGDKISASQRTANIKAFCGTIQNAGYKAGVYANRTWFTSQINTSSLTSYRIWLAQYAASVTYNATRYDMWQYTSKGKVTGISGNVDMNICY